jgi:antagonist of KipI
VTASLRVIKPGMLTTIQDRGRWGFQSHGVPVAGPMDPCSHRVANAVVGNDDDAATLEVTLLGPELEFEDERLVAVAGAEFELTVDGEPVRASAGFVVRAGARLRFGRRHRGSRAYIGIAGGVTVPPALGSRATHLISGMGGFEGRALKAGDRLPLGDPSKRARLKPSGNTPEAGPFEPSRAAAVRTVPAVTRLPQGSARIRVLPGPQADYFAADALEILQSAPYVVGLNSDRMGFRLEGPTLTHARGADIISDATPLGVLQVPSSGQPILLMADRQTAGGYPKIATVISADIGIAGQLGPSDTLEFVVCSPREAMSALITQERLLMLCGRNHG